MFDKFKLANSMLVGMAQSVSVKPERCSRMCHKNAKCNLCETNCPVGVIQVGTVGTSISIKWDECSYCGICINICPTGVYGVRELGYEGFLKSYLKGIDDRGILTLSCRESVKNEDTKSSAENADLVECLGIFGLADFLWFYVNGAKEIVFIFPDCDTCVNMYGKSILTDELAELIKLSAYFEHLEGTEIKEEDKHIRIIFPKSFERTKPLQKMDEIKAESVTRRGMFELLGRNAKDTALRSAVLLTPQEIPKRTPFRTEKILPVKRRIFLDGLTNCGKILKEETSAGPYFFAIDIAPGCNLCRVCVRFCPTEAIKMSEDEKEILFTPAYCLSCGMCLISCYHKYISRKKTVNIRELFKEEIKASKPS